MKCARRTARTPLSVISLFVIIGLLLPLAIPMDALAYDDRLPSKPFEPIWEESDPDVPEGIISQNGMTAEGSSWRVSRDSLTFYWHIFEQLIHLF